MPIATEEAIELLGSKASKERRRAAKQLRVSKSRAGCEALLSALRKEIEDSRTWETQYQMIMALGELRCENALEFLSALTGRSFEKTAVYTALGDAIVRLAIRGENDISPVMDLIATRQMDLINGAFRATAMMHLKASDEDVVKIVEFCESLSPAEAIDRGLWFWVAVAATNWKNTSAKHFLEKCASCGREDIEKAARFALEGKSIKYRPL